MTSYTYHNHNHNSHDHNNDQDQGGHHHQPRQQQPWWPPPLPDPDIPTLGTFLPHNLLPQVPYYTTTTINDNTNDHHHDNHADGNHSDTPTSIRKVTRVYICLTQSGQTASDNVNVWLDCLLISTVIWHVWPCLASLCWSRTCTRHNMSTECTQVCGTFNHM